MTDRHKQRTGTWRMLAYSQNSPRAKGRGKSRLQRLESTGAGKLTFAL